MKVRYSDEAIMNGLRERNTRYIEYFYKEYFQMVRTIVMKNSGSNADAQDLFHDGLIVLYDKLITGPLVLKASLKTYFHSICWHTWMRRLERKNKLLYTDESTVEEGLDAYGDSQEDIDEVLLERRRLMGKYFNQLPADCQKLLILYSQKVPFTEIAEIMNFKDASIVKSRKYKCKRMLKEKMKNDPNYKDFLPYD